MKYIIEQFPKNKDISPNKLSPDQKEIRRNKNIERYKDGIRCSCCQILQDCTEFYFQNKETGLRQRTCRDCKSKNAGTVEVGRNRISQKIFKKGFQRCYICREIKPLSSFTKKKRHHRGYREDCNKCKNIIDYKYTKQRRIKKRELIKLDPNYKKMSGMYSHKTSGYKVTDTVTNQVWLFKKARDPEFLKMFSCNTITNALKTGEKTNVTITTKYKNPCIIERLTIK